MFRNDLHPRRWGAAIVLFGLLFSSAGCQSISMPWSSARGLPAQWEPQVDGQDH